MAIIDFLETAKGHICVHVSTVRTVIRSDRIRVSLIVLSNEFYLLIYEFAFLKLRNS